MWQRAVSLTEELLEQVVTSGAHVLYNETSKRGRRQKRLKLGPLDSVPINSTLLQVHSHRQVHINRYEDVCKTGVQMQTMQVKEENVERVLRCWHRYQLISSTATAGGSNPMVMQVHSDPLAPAKTVATITLLPFAINGN